MTRRRWWSLAALAVVGWLLACGYLLARAGLDLRAARDAAQRARDGIDASSIADGAPLPDLREARDRFRSAAGRTGNPVLAPVRLLPVVGRQVRAVHALASAAATVSDAATVALDRAQLALQVDRPTNQARLAQVRELTAAVTAADRRVRGVTDLGPRVGLVGPVRTARNELAAKLTEARRTLADAAAGARAGLGLLTGPRRYLVVAANPAEMRAGSGMWLSGGVLTTRNGSLRLGEVAPLYQQADPRDGAVPIPDAQFAALWEADWRPTWDWRSLMTSPRLPVSAALGRAMWSAAGKPPVDGILVVDPVGLAAVVRATGPVQAGGRTVTADEVVPLLLNGQYQAVGSDPSEQVDRREALGAIAGAAFSALNAGGWSPATLAGELAGAIAGRHLLAWSADPTEQRGWTAAGMAGDLGPDSLAVSVLNRGVNKLDAFLRVDAELTTVAAGGGTDVAVRIRLRNETPDGQPRYVTGPAPGFPWEPGRYVGVLALDVPGAATGVRLEGGAVVTAGPEGPVQVVATEVSIPKGQGTQVVVRFHLPQRHGRLAVEPSARVPGIAWRYGSGAWQDSRRRTAKF